MDKSIKEVGRAREVCLKNAEALLAVAERELDRVTRPLS
jgi:hypothetical protein